MLNIVSLRARRDEVSGPAKVMRNLTKGLERLGYPYVVNRRLDATLRLWLHDDIVALRSSPRRRMVVGPNLFVLPQDIPRGVDLSEAVYVQPSAWVKELWEDAGFAQCPIEVWPVGVDTEEFVPTPDAGKAYDALVYHKKRDPVEMERILATLRELRLSYVTVTYGHYRESDYRRLLDQVRLVVWHGGPESQGLALQEAMSCNLPILVCDVTRLGDALGGYGFPARYRDWPVSSAPYFDERCGAKIVDLGELEPTLRRMIGSLSAFAPRAYVKERLSLDGQAEALLGLWTRWGLGIEEGRDEVVLEAGAYRHPFRNRAHGAAVRLRDRLSRSQLEGHYRR